MILADLTPADFGALAATFDDCMRSGFGDDDTCDALAAVMQDAGNWTLSEGEAFALAWEWFRSRFED